MSSTDTNQASELYEICKEVYERTGWEDVTDFYHENDTFDEETQTFKRNGIFSIVERKRADYNIPLYTSDYLLEKLPGLLDIDNKTFSLAVQAQVAPPNFVALYTHTSVVAGKLAGHSTRYINEADTPLKALLKLTIALSEAGELK